MDFTQAVENFFEIRSALPFPPDAIPSASGFMYVYARIQDGSCIPGGPLKWHFAFGTCVLIMRDSVSIKMISCDASLEALCSGIGFHVPSLRFMREFLQMIIMLSILIHIQGHVLPIVVGSAIEG